VTVERKIVVGLEDIEAICLECLGNKCHFKISFSPDQQGKIPEKCPQCDLQWYEKETLGYMNKKVLPFSNFSNSIEIIRASMREAGTATGFRIVLEFKEPTTDSSTAKPQPS
jgi:hypothetical protein